MFVKSNIICNFVALANTLTVCASKRFLSRLGTPIETPFEPYVRDEATNRGFLFGANQANQTCKTSLLGSCNCNYETKHSWINYFSGSFFFFVSYFLTLLLFFTFSFGIINYKN